MERTQSKIEMSELGLFRFLRIGLIILSSLIPLSAAQSEVVLVPPQAPPPLNAERFPTSSFSSNGGSYADPAPRRSYRGPASVGESHQGHRSGGNSVYFSNTQISNHPTHADPLSRAQRSPNSKFDPGQKVLPKRLGGIQEIALIADQLGYFPKTIFVTRNIPVRLFVTSSTQKPLCIIMDGFNVKRQISSKKVQEIQFTPCLLYTSPSPRD